VLKVRTMPFLYVRGPLPALLRTIREIRLVLAVRTLSAQVEDCGARDEPGKKFGRRNA
jgi:hypothetical protein